MIGDEEDITSSSSVCPAQSRLVPRSLSQGKGKTPMNYATIKTNDVANGPGVRVSLFVSGCRHHCKGCFNSEAWDFHYGSLFDEKTADTLLQALAPDYIDGISLLGGEPFEPENQPELLHLLRRIKAELPQKSIWCYTGFCFETQLLAGKVGDPAVCRALLSCIDVLVDGKFEEDKKDPSLIFRGSSNQNIIDVPASLAQQRTVLLPGVWKRTMGSGNIYDA